MTSRHVRRGLKTAVTVLLLLAAAAGAAAAAGEPAADAIVACYDAKRDLVTHSTAAACHGEIIDHAREAALAAERARRVRAALAERKAAYVLGNRHLIGTGSGFYVGPHGEVVTNDHVIDHCDMLTVTSDAGPRLPAPLVARDPTRDIALLRTGTRPPAVARFAAKPRDLPSSTVSVVGYPAYGLPTVRASIVPGRAMPLLLATPENQVVFAGAIRRGHSGSPLLDAAGEVVGMVRAKPDTVKIYEATGHLPAEFGIAISQAALLHFLAAHDVHPLLAAGAPLSRAAVFAKARRFVVRVGCWQ